MIKKISTHEVASLGETNRVEYTVRYSDTGRVSYAANPQELAD